MWEACLSLHLLLKKKKKKIHISLASSLIYIFRKKYKKRRKERSFQPDVRFHTIDSLPLCHAVAHADMVPVLTQAW